MQYIELLDWFKSIEAIQWLHFRIDSRWELYTLAHI